jgi:hypothetical protein
MKDEPLHQTFEVSLRHTLTRPKQYLQRRATPIRHSNTTVGTPFMGSINGQNEPNSFIRNYTLSVFRRNSRDGQKREDTLRGDIDIMTVIFYFGAQYVDPRVVLAVEICVLKRNKRFAQRLERARSDLRVTCVLLQNLKNYRGVIKRMGVF